MHSMDYSQYENYGFDRFSAFNLSTGYRERSYQAHWHSYGEIVLVGPGKTNVYKVNQNTYELVEGDFLLIWPMEMHAIIDADRKDSLVIQFSNAFMNSLFDLQRIMHFYRNLHVLCINAHPQLVAGLRTIAEKMKEMGIRNISAYARKMLLDGYCVKLDLTDIRELVRLTGYAGNNLNQYAKCAHETKNIYAADVEDLKVRFDRIVSPTQPNSAVRWTEIYIYPDSHQGFRICHTWKIHL